MIRHASAGHPNEACGMLLGRIQADTYIVLKAVLTPNQMRSPVRFAIPDEDIIQAYRTAAEEGMEVVGVYHSHPASPAEPSGTDARYMELNPGAWVIYSGMDGRMRAWTMQESVEEITIRTDCDIPR